MRILHIAIGVTVAALLGLSVWGCIGLTNHIIMAVDKFGDAGAGIAQTTAKLNGPHGTIAMMDEDAGAAKSLIIHADLAARHEQQQLTTWDTRGAVLFSNLNGGVTDLRTTINAATGTANAATATLGEGQRTLAAARPVLDEAAATVKDVHAVVPEVARTAKGTADTMENTAGITKDGRMVADHYTDAILNPKTRPWYIKMLPTAFQDLVQAALTKYAVK
jgi:hypothetical protein